MKISGMIWNSLAWVGSGGGGFMRCCANMVMPRMIGHTPRCRIGLSPVGSNGIRPKPLNRLVGSGAERSRIQPKNGAWRISMVT